MRPYLFTAFVVGAVALSACAPTRYSYAPVTTTSAELEGVSAAVYPIPPGAPRGEVRVAMLGLGSVSPAGVESGSTSGAIHLALAVSNRSEEDWTVDISEQRVTLTMKRERHDVYATTGDVPRATAVLVPPRSTRVIDLYFPLPIELQKENAPPPFDVFWTVHAGSRAITQRTPFERFIVAPTPEQERDLRAPGGFRDQDLSEPGPYRPEHAPIVLPHDDVE